MKAEETKNPVCLDCGADDGTLLKEFDDGKSYSWGELADMTPVCACCGSENLSTAKKGA
jgi:hypothetical protein